MDDTINVGIMTALVKAHDLMGQQQIAHARLATAFILGEKLYREDRRQHQGTPTYSMKAFDALQQLAYELDAVTRIDQNGRANLHECLPFHGEFGERGSLWKPLRSVQQEIYFKG